MSRRRLPRRFPGLSHTPLKVLALTPLACLAFYLGVGVAAAQPNRPIGLDNDTRARTSIGTPMARACGQYAMNGVSTDQAIAACDRALADEHLPRMDQINTYINRGTLHMRRGEAADALADFDTVIAAAPNNAEAQLNRGAALLMNHQPGPAVAAITTALSLGVQQPYKAYYNRGAARESLGDLRGAYEDYTTALQIHPNWAPAEAEIARFVHSHQAQLATTLSSENQAPGSEPAPPQRQ